MPVTSSTYSPRNAWRLAFVVFAVYWLGAAAVEGTVEHGPLDLLASSLPAQWTSDLMFLATAAAMFVVVGIGYWVIWPLGTETHGRSLNVPAAGGFGVAWGASEGTLYLTLFALVAAATSLRWVQMAVVFIILSGFKAVWHTRFWDIYVSPVHNIEAWNLRKVLFVHTPNLLVSLTFLTVYGVGWLFVAAQVVALVGSTLAMHFPSPFSDDGEQRTKDRPAT